MSRRLEDLQPEFAALVRKLLTTCEARGLRLLLTDGLRDFLEQGRLYAKGRTQPGAVVTMARPGQSLHNFGLAADFCFLDETGKATWKGPWQQFGSLVVRAPLVWGGGWRKFSDNPHVQMPGWTWQKASKLWPGGWSPS